MGCQKFARGPWPALDDYCKPASNLRRSQLLLAELHNGRNAHGSRGAHGLHRDRPPSGHQGLSRAAQHKQHKAAEHVYDERNRGFLSVRKARRTGQPTDKSAPQLALSGGVFGRTDSRRTRK